MKYSSNKSEFYKQVETYFLKRHHVNSTFLLLKQFLMKTFDPFEKSRETSTGEYLRKNEALSGNDRSLAGEFPDLRCLMNASRIRHEIVNAQFDCVREQFLLFSLFEL